MGKAPFLAKESKLYKEKLEQQNSIMAELRKNYKSKMLM